MCPFNSLCPLACSPANIHFVIFLVSISSPYTPVPTVSADLIFWEGNLKSFLYLFVWLRSTIEWYFGIDNVMARPLACRVRCQMQLQSSGSKIELGIVAF